MAPPSEPQRKWNLAEKVLFRFFFVYFVLYIFPFPLDFLPFIGDYASGWTEGFWAYIAPKIGAGILGIDYPINTVANGSGDTTFAYVQLFTVFSLSVIVCILWSAIAYKRKEYRKLFTLLHIGLRYYLGFVLLLYGISKLFTNQFSSLSLFDLIKTYGASSPMGLLWNFMEFSDAYTIFSGFGEVLGGVLLFFRKTTKLGALVSIGVMVNVVMMNFSYDIPVKLYSSHLLFMAFWILLPYLKNMIRFFIKNKPTASDPHSVYFSKKKFNILGYGLKGLLIVYIIVSFIDRSVENQKIYGKKMPKPPLYGIYEVTEFIQNRDTVAPLLTETTRWRTFVVNSGRAYGFKSMDDRITYLTPELDTAAQKLVLRPWEAQDTAKVYRFTYRYKDSILSLEGTCHTDTLHISLKQIDHTDFLLLKRGFHWINESPYNR